MEHVRARSSIIIRIRHGSMSGYPGDAVSHNGLIDSRLHLLAKPFRKAELAQKIREILDERDEE